jgi:hypothetical protein
MTRRRVHSTLTAAILTATLSTGAAAAGVGPGPADAEARDRERPFLAAAVEALLARLAEVFAPRPAAAAARPPGGDAPEAPDDGLVEGPSIDPIG